MIEVVCKPNREDWADLLDHNEDFRDKFQKVYDYDGIPEADQVKDLLSEEKMNGILS